MKNGAKRYCKPDFGYVMKMRSCWLVSDVGGKIIWVTNGRDHSPTAVLKIKAGSPGQKHLESSDQLSGGFHATRWASKRPTDRRECARHGDQSWL